jgi:hypothetical protein
MRSLKEVIVVISSPGDVGKERAALPNVIQRLNKNIAGPAGLILSVRRWEDAPPGFWDEGVQHHIDSYLKIEDSDIFIGILWKNFGTPGRDGKTGTEHEFHKAYEAWKKNNRPKIMLYFNQKLCCPTMSEQAKQLAAVLRFKEGIQKEGLYSIYNKLEQFKEKVYDHLSDYIKDEVQQKLQKSGKRDVFCGYCCARIVFQSDRKPERCNYCQKRIIWSGGTQHNLNA